MPELWRKPLDADEALIPRGDVFVIRGRCKGCALCVEFCPTGILFMSDGFNAKGYHTPEVSGEGVCVNCKLCEMLCPEFAIYSLPAGEAGSSRAGSSEVAS